MFGLPSLDKYLSEQTMLVSQSVTRDHVPSPAITIIHLRHWNTGHGLQSQVDGGGNLAPKIEPVAFKCQIS